jgi:hypothetical protein
MSKAIGALALVFGVAFGLAFGGSREHCTSPRPSDSCQASAHAHLSRARVVVLLGDKTVEPSIDGEMAGRSEAFSFRALRSGYASSIALYVDTSNRAKSVTVAIYTSARGEPAALLTSGSTQVLRRGTWISIGVRSQRLQKGTNYWLAVLGSGGVLRFRDRASGGCSSRESAQMGLKRFPKRWQAGPRWATCPISAYVRGRMVGSSPPPPPPKPPTTTRPMPRPRMTGCAAHPSACGYPDRSNTGVPAGVTLTPSGTITAGNNTTISGKDVTGSIEVTGNNVTIKNTRVTNTGDTASAIHIAPGVAGTTIENSTLRGQARTNAIQYAVSNSGSRTIGRGLQMYYCSECWAGNGKLQDSYAISDATINGAHYEAVYVPGGTTSPTALDHNTLLNPHDQTAGIFGDDHAYGPIHNLTINNNLVADGGDNGAIATGCRGDGNTNVNITNNRLSFIYDQSMPTGGYGEGSWTGNYRDDTLAPLDPAC